MQNFTLKDILGKIANMLHNSQTHIFLYKVKSHAVLPATNVRMLSPNIKPAKLTKKSSVDTIISIKHCDGNSFLWLASDNLNLPMRISAAILNINRVGQFRINIYTPYIRMQYIRRIYYLQRLLTYFV